MILSSDTRTNKTTGAGRCLVWTAGFAVFIVAFAGIFCCHVERADSAKNSVSSDLTEEQLMTVIRQYNMNDGSGGAAESFSFLRATAADPKDLMEQVRPFWQAWKVRHGHDTNNDLEEDDTYRLQVFTSNAMAVAQHNAAYQAGWTLYAQTVLQSPFAHLTAQEFTATHLMESQNCSATTTQGSVNAVTTPRLHDIFDLPGALPAAVDWRTRGILTPVKNQQHCGSCWTFSTSGTLEAHTCLHHPHHGMLDCPTWTGLAEQQLLDCAWNYDNHGCNGGLPSHAFEYLKHAGGMATEQDYPYTAQDSHNCRIPQDDANDSDHHHHPHRAQVAAVYNISNRDEDDLVAAVAHMGPVSIAYQVSPDFRFYSHGVYDSYNATSNTTICSDDNMSVNHAVVAVGYGVTADKVPYYIVRNSWSATWGMEGHFWMLRGKNLCGVSDCASFPLVPASPYTAQWEAYHKVKKDVWTRTSHDVGASLPKRVEQSM